MKIVRLRNEMKWNEMKWNEMKWNEMKWNEMKWNEMKWNEMKWNEMKWNEMRIAHEMKIKFVLFERTLKNEEYFIFHILLGCRDIYTYVIFKWQHFNILENRIYMYLTE